MAELSKRLGVRFFADDPALLGDWFFIGFSFIFLFIYLLSDVVFFSLGKYD